MTAPLEGLLDAKRLAAELGITRAAAECVMRQLPTVRFPGLRKSYCRRCDVAALLERSTFAKTEVPTSNHLDGRGNVVVHDIGQHGGSWR